MRKKRRNKRKKKTIALVFGGTSNERFVSLNSAKSVARYLDEKKYNIVPVEIDRQGKWLLSSPTIKQIGKLVKTKKSTTRELVPVQKNSKGKIDTALLILHGPGGEDGTIQGMLELLGIPYTFSGVLASAVAMDKARTKKLLVSSGIPVLPHMLINKKDWPEFKKSGFKKLKGTLVVKPNHLGSSIGVTISRDKKALVRGIEAALRLTKEVIVEPFVKGREITVPVLGNRTPRALPAVEILPWKRSTFYDFKAKYEEGGSEHVIPANLSKEETATVQELAMRAHAALGCKGVTRSDFMLDERGNFYFLEINTIPGMTPTSLVPQSAEAAGISFSQLLDELIRLAQQK